jgi:asparagine synthase (glutamine-hydrolysing)
VASQAFTRTITRPLLLIGQNSSASVSICTNSSGAWFSQDGRIGLGHRRLAIIDLSANAQPMLSADAQYAVTFNGEIYNYRELREHLERQGRRFQSASDTEV